MQNAHVVGKIPNINIDIKRKRIRQAAWSNECRRAGIQPHYYKD